MLGGVVGVLGVGPTLLVLDNCEHVVRGVADLVQSLVSMTRDLRVLTTSRAPLGLSSEAVYLLGELSLPAGVALFTQRARAARPTVELDAGAVERVCRDLEGLPLAIELAAARVRVMSVPDIAAHLPNRFALLRGGTQDAPERHRALAAVIGWSWNLLDADGQAAMRALSIFPAGFSAEAATHLLGTQAWAVLTQLTEQSLLKVADTAVGARLHMLETVREFSAAQRDAAETAEVVARFVAWAGDFGTAHHDSVFGADPVAAAGLIRSEVDNLVLALRHGLDRADGQEVAAISAVLGSLWLLESDFARMGTLSAQIGWLLSHTRAEPSRVEVVRTAAVLSTVSEFFTHGPHATRALAVLRRLPTGRSDTVIRAIHKVLLTPEPPAEGQAPVLGYVAGAAETFRHQNANDLTRALAAAERMLDVAGALPSPLLALFAHSRIGELSLETGDGDRARGHLAAVLPLLAEFGAPSNLIRARWALAMANLQAGDPDQAARWLDDAIVPGDDHAVVLGLRAEIMLGRGQVEAGLRAWRRVTDRLGQTGDPLAAVDRTVLEWWLLEARSVTVVAHAQHGRLALVRAIAEPLPLVLNDFLSTRPVKAQFPVYGALLLAVATADIADGRPGAAMVALAERFRFARGYQPTMSPRRARETAENADKAAYTGAHSAYAGLDTDGLVAAALAALRDRLMPPGPV